MYMYCTHTPEDKDYVRKNIQETDSIDGLWEGL